MNKRFIFIFLFSLLQTFGFAQDKEYVFTHISKEDKLLSNSVNQTIKDSKGLIWFATINGLQLCSRNRIAA